ncbi:MAG: DNA repair protein RecO [Bacillota bacterium]
MTEHKFKGIVIAEENVGENNKRITVLAKQTGKVVFFAKGARQVQSPLFSGTQLFSYCEFVACMGPTYNALTQVDLIKSFHTISMDINKLSEAVYIGQLMDRTIPHGEEQNEVLKLFYHLLHTLEKGKIPPELISRIFEIKYLQISGYFPEMHCSSCGDMAYQHLYYNGATGEFVCKGHRSSEKDFLLQEGLQQAIVYVLNNTGKSLFKFRLSDELLEQLYEVLGKYIKFHLGFLLASRSFSKKLEQ